jgi:hypothetical protein
MGQAGAETPWHAACRLHSTLYNGWALDPVPAPFPELGQEPGEHVVGVFPTGPGEQQLGYARWLADDVVVTSGGKLVVGTPHFLAGYALGSAVSAARTRRKARRLAQPQWHHRPMTCAVVTTRRLWCDLSEGGWQHFAYSHTTDVVLDGDMVVLHFTGSVASLRLDGPWAAWIAVAIAHHRFGGEALRRLPWLAALHKAMAST